MGKLLEEFNTELFQLNSILSVVSKKKPPTYWSTDGVHPTPIDHSLIAESCLTKCKSPDKYQSKK